MIYKTTQSSLTHDSTYGVKRIMHVAMRLLCILCIVYNSGYFISTTDETKGSLWLLIATIPLFILCLRKIFLKKRLGLVTTVYFMWMILYVCSIIVNFDMLTLKSFRIPMLMITFAFSISYLMDLEVFSQYFIMSMKIITIISLVTFVFRTIILENIPLPTVTNVNGAVYHNGILFSFIDFYGNMNVRNIGVFWEPGLFASFLILAIVFEIYFNTKKARPINILLFILGILSTQSSAGYLLLPFVAVLIFCKNKKNGFWFAYIILILALLVYLNYDSIIQYLLTINYELFSKFKETTSTVTTRLNAPLVNLNIFKNYPLFGAGFNHADSLYLQSMFSFDVTAQTSTSTYFMAVMGIFGSMYTFLWCFGILKIRNMNFTAKITLMCIILIILNKEPHSSILFTYCFLFYLLKESSAKRKLEHLVNEP